LRLLFKINNGGTAVLMATHDHSFVQNFGQRIIHLRDGKVDEGECKTLGVAPGSVRPFTFADLGADYGTLAGAVKAHVKATAAASADDLIYSLIVEDAMQREINGLVSTLRPVTDKAASRATSVLVKMLRDQGKSEAEISAALSALGIK